MPFDCAAPRFPSDDPARIMCATPNEGAIVMASEIRQVSYVYITTPNKAGEAARVLQALRDGGVNLLATIGFPSGRAKAQIDLVTDDVDALKSVAKKQKWKLSKVKRAFLVEGEDVLGAAVEPLEKLAAAKINIVAAVGVAAGEGRYGMILWVEPRHYRRATKVVGAS
jgi:hypothetical protein